MKRTWRAALLSALIVTAVALAGPAAAGAATSVQLGDRGIGVIGDAFANDIEVRRVADGYVVTDARARIEVVPGSPCFVTSTLHEAKCLSDPEVTVLAEGGAGGDTLTVIGGTRSAVLEGQGGDDVLVGAGAPDTLRGGPAGDRLRGGGGADVLDGEAGADSLEGGVGIDTVSYSDRVAAVNITLPVDSFDARADDGNLTDGPVAGLRDTIDPDVENAIGGDGADTLVGNNAANVLNGRNGNDALFGRGGDDLLNGGLGADLLTGNDGIDAAFYGDRTTPVTVTLDGTANDGNPTQDLSLGSGIIVVPTTGSSDNVASDVEGAVGGSGPDLLDGDDGPNLLDGRGGEDRIFGRGGDDDLRGGDGDDFLGHDAGRDDISGGAGRDSVNYELEFDPVSVSLDGVANDGNQLDGVRDNVRADVDAVVGTHGDDVLVGSDDGELLDGFLGSDRLEGRGGNDTLNGGDIAPDLLDGGEGTDTATYQGTGSPVTVTLDGVANDGTPPGAPQVLLPAGFAGENDNVLTENVTGGDGDDTIIGDEGPNALAGGRGNDTLHGAGASDSVSGDAGRDAMLGEAGGDLLLANDGETDQVNCGPDADLAQLDLADAAGAIRGGGVLAASAGCEAQNLAPAGRLPNVALAAKTVRVDRRRRAHLALRCPRRSPRRCAGTVRLQRLDSSDLGAARFAIRRGQRTTVTVRLRRPVRPGAARILARERDVDGRPKLTLARVRLRR